MSALRELLAKLDIEVTGADKARHADGALEGFKKTAEGVAKFLAVGAIAEGLKSMIEGLEEQAVQLDKTSQVLGINTTDLQAWQFAAKLSHVEAEEFTGAVKKMEIAAGKASENGAMTGGAFQKLGVNLRDTSGKARPVVDVLRDTGLALAQMPDQYARADAGREIFGRGATTLMPLFNKGAEGLKEMLKQVDKLGGGLSAEAIEQLGGLKETTERWDMALTSAKSALVVQFLPALTSMLTGLTKNVVELVNNKTAMEHVKSGVIAMGVAGAGAAAAFITPWLPAIAFFSGLFLILDDLRVGLGGGKSLFGKVLDQLYGKGSGQTFFAQVKKDVEDLIAGVKQLISDLSALTGHDRVAKEHLKRNVNQAFGGISILKTPDALTDEEAAAKAKIEEEDKRLYGNTRQRRRSGQLRPWEEGYSEGGALSHPVQEAMWKAQSDALLRKTMADLKPASPSSTADVLAGLKPGASIGDLIAAARGLPTSMAGGGKGDTKQQTITQNSTATYNITAPNSDPKAIVDAASASQQEQRRADHAALATFAVKP